MLSAKCGFNDNGVLGKVALIQWGPTIYTDIGFDPKYVSGSGNAPVAGVTGLHALVDTGASESCIDTLLAAQLNLPIVDKRMTAGAHGAKEVSVHLAQVHIPSLGFTITGAFAGVALREGGQAHFALLGRTFLQHFKMIYNGHTGDVEITSPKPLTSPANPAT